MENEIFLNGLLIAAAFFIICWAMSPVVSRLDRISFVIAKMNPQLHGMIALKMYWHLYKNENALKQMEEQSNPDEKN